MFGPLKDLFRGSKEGPQGFGPPQAGGRARALNGSSAVDTRSSRGLEEFFTHIRDQSGLTILDLGGATQKNVSFITELGHRLYSEGFLSALKDTFGADDTEQSNPGRIEFFLKQTLDYPAGHFD